ncbi:hypothetical protein ACHAWF_002668 [Thalassiosira exigua]
MPAAPFMPNQKRRSRTLPAEMQYDNGDNNAVQEYKQCLEEIQRENPDLSIGAMQQMALERCAKLKSDREGQQTKQQSALGLGRMISKLRKGKDNEVMGGCGKGAELKSDQEGQQRKRQSALIGMMAKLRMGNEAVGGLGEEAIESKVSTTRRWSSGVPPKVDKRQSLAKRRSVASISSGLRFSSKSLDIKCDSEDSLQGDLEDIEKSSRPRMPQDSNGHQESCEFEDALQSSLEKIETSGRRRRMSQSSNRNRSRRLSNVSLGLSDVEEDEESKPPALPDKDGRLLESWASSKMTSVASGRKNKQTNMDESFSGSLPNEIKLVLDGFTPKGRSRPKDKAPTRSGHGSARSLSSHDESDNSNSFMESFVSVDSANFEGDFSAWRSSRTPRN